MFQSPYHLVDRSPWPFLTSLTVFLLVEGLVMFFQFKDNFSFFFSVFLLILSVICWWRDVIRESTFQGFHAKVVEGGLKMGMILFIVSEVLFFFSFFWSYFNMSLVYCLELGFSWPSSGINAFNCFEVPLLGTVVLLSSGVSVTWSHHSILENKFQESEESLMLTWMLGMYFLLIQFTEYSSSEFCFSDSVYGSLFFLLTGFHGFHVFVGVVFLIVCWFRMICFHFSKIHFSGYEFSVWYWHFVDVVWLFLYCFVYWWGS